jgi:predicted permease
MNRKRGIVRVFGGFGGKTRERELGDEIRSHIEIQTDQNIADGMEPAAARRAAMLKFGNAALAREDSRAMWRFPSLDSVAGDIRFGWRILRSAPGFAAVAVLTLALAIGATTAIFSVTYTVLFKPLPYRDAQQLFLIHQYNKNKDSGNWRTTAFDFLDWRSRSQAFSSIGAYTGTGVSMSGNGEAEVLLGQRISSDLFPTLQVTPMLGRNFRTDEEEAGKDKVVILSYGLWQRRFGGDAQIIGRSVRLNSEPHTIIGVMPRGFAFPTDEYSAWLPLAFRGPVDSQVINRSAHFMRSVGRLKPGVSATAAAAEIKRIQEDLERQYPDTDIGEGARIESLTKNIVGDVRPSLLLLLAAAGCVMLIACTNIANLLLARGASRQREVAVRQALGAGVGRVLRQFITENLVLAAIGGGFGIALAYALVAAVITFGPRDLPRLNEIAVDPTVLAFAAAVSLLTGLIFGLFPLWSVRQAAIADSLKNAAKSISHGHGMRRLRAVLVTAEIAISGVLLIVAGLTLHSLARLGAVDAGFNPNHAVSFTFVLMDKPYRTAAQLRAFAHEFYDRVAAGPGVNAVGLSTGLPLSGENWSNPVSSDRSSESALADINAVAGNYFAAMQTPIRHGRPLASSEAGERVVVINETAATKLFPAEDPIGRHVKFGQANSSDAWRTVVGVAADVKERGLDTAVDPEIYIPYDQLSDRVTEFVGRGLYTIIRSDADAAATVSFARRQLAQMDPEVGVRDVRLLREMVSASVAQPRFRTFVFSTFAALALVLAGVGLYGVLAYMVAQRTREFGIRLALGANPAKLRRLVFAQGVPLVAIGVMAGGIAALAADRALRTLVFGIAPRDPLTFAAVLGVVAVVAIVAMAVPAWRAMRVDPLQAIRYE